jgi:hypothetical protein
MFAQQFQPLTPSQQPSVHQANVQLSVQQPVQAPAQSQVPGLHGTITAKASAKETQVHPAYLTFAQQLKLLAPAQPDQLSQIHASDQEPQPVKHSQMSIKYSSIQPLPQLLPVQESVISQTLAPVPLSSVKTAVYTPVTAQWLPKETSDKQIETQELDQLSDLKALKQQCHFEILPQPSEDHASVKKLPVQSLQKASAMCTEVQTPAIVPTASPPDNISHQLLKNQAGVHSSPINLQFAVTSAQWFQEESPIVQWTEFQVHKHLPPVQVPYQSSPLPVGAQFRNLHQQHQAFTQIQFPVFPVPAHNFYPSYPQLLCLPAKFSGYQLHQLCMNAIYYTVSKRQQGKVQWKAVDVFCRAEPDKYYAMIENSEARTEFPYIKNNNGHLMSHINGNIDGLYLGAGECCVHCLYRSKNLIRPKLYSMKHPIAHAQNIGY